MKLDGYNLVCELLEIVRSGQILKPLSQTGKDIQQAALDSVKNIDMRRSLGKGRQLASVARRTVFPA